MFKKNMISRDSLHLDQFGDSMKRLLVIAIPAGLTTIIQPLANAVITALLAAYGVEVVAAYGVVSRVEAFAMLFIIALSLGMAPIVGQNWGAGNYARVHEAISQAIRFNFIWCAFIAVIFGVFAKRIAGEFSHDPLVIEYVALFFWIVPFSYGFGNLVFGWSSAFNAMGKPQRSFVMIFVKAILMTIPAVYLGRHFYGVAGIFWAVAITNIASGILFHIISIRARNAQEEKRIAAIKLAT
jgi:Na+-driven multidrug efflux pump